jgi:low affinity Fe/Cu permease
MTQQSSAAQAGTWNAPTPKRLSLYQRMTDAVSYAQGTPYNLTFWLIAIGLWFAFGPELARATFIPAWASSNEWNFPLNTGTSCLELFIGFLVAASTNRSERNLENTLAGIGAQGRKISEVEDKLTDALAANTELTRQVRDLTVEVHALVSAMAPKPVRAAGGHVSEEDS